MSQKASAVAPQLEGPIRITIPAAVANNGGALPGKNLLNTGCKIYQAIAQIMGSKESLRFGRMYYRQISGDGVHFGFPSGTTYTLAFSRLLYNREIFVAYNVSADPRTDRVVVDATLHRPGDTMAFLYPQNKGTTRVETAPDGTLFVRLDLDGRQFALLE
jgi:alpha-amylase